MKIIPVIIAGGNGTRLWPLSRGMYPKQFLPLIGEQTMLQQTCLRANAITDEPVIIICNEEHRFIASEQLRLIDQSQYKIILEPQGRNTAPAIALAALQIQESHDDAIMLVLSADHYIEDIQNFKDTVLLAANHAQQKGLITFGVTPTQPETGYGYIKKGPSHNGDVFDVAQFEEKPNLDTAKQYLTSGQYLWNSGMFVFSAQTYLAQLSQYNPTMSNICKQAFEQKQHDNDFIRPDKALFLTCPDDSIDYAVMEKTDQAKVIPLQSKWSDVGSWSSLWELNEKDDKHNVETGEVINVDSHNNYIHSNEKLTAVIGLENTVIIDTKDALLVANKDNVQDIKKVVQNLKQTNNKQLTDVHREVYRPWGKYDSIDSGERYQVKRITVKPGAKLSVQMHHHRSEHWVVVSGTAKVTINESTKIIGENESVYIPVGAIHSLENPGRIDLELIEVQSGSYLGEDDIVRFEDKYGRT